MLEVLRLRTAIGEVLSVDHRFIGVICKLYAFANDDFDETRRFASDAGRNLRDVTDGSADWRTMIVLSRVCRTVKLEFDHGEGSNLLAREQNWIHIEHATGVRALS